MNDDAILALARQHGIDLGTRVPPRLVSRGEVLKYERVEGLTPYGERLVEFARGLVAAERERCAVLCETLEHGAFGPPTFLNGVEAGAKGCANAIRSGKEPAQPAGGGTDADAKRYQWLKSRHPEALAAVAWGASSSACAFPASELDAAIDQAMKAWPGDAPAGGRTP